MSFLWVSAGGLSSFLKMGFLDAFLAIFHRLVLFMLGLVNRECVNEEESESENCECGWLWLFKVFPFSFFSRSLSLLTLPPSLVWRWSSFLCGTWCSLMQRFGSLLVFKVYYLSCYLATVTESASLALFALTCKLLVKEWYRNNWKWYKLIVFFIIHSNMRSQTHQSSWKCSFIKNIWHVFRVTLFCFAFCLIWIPYLQESYIFI